jgi:hypothetical protein
MPATRRVDLKTMVMPDLVRAEVTRLLVALEAAESTHALLMAAQRAEGFVLGLETAGFHKHVIEDFYIGFETAAEVRFTLLEKT